MSVQGIPCDVFIANDKFRNRALDGDVVALRLLSIANWKDTTVPVNTSEGDAGSIGDDNGGKLNAQHAAKEVNLLWRPIAPKHGALTRLRMFLSPTLAKQSRLYTRPLTQTMDRAEASPRGHSQAGLQPHAEVVGILDRKSTSNIICVMDTFCEAGRLHPGKPLPTSENFVRLKPVDKRFPYMLLPRHKSSKRFYCRSPWFTVNKIVCRASTCGWNENSRFAKCTIVRQLGEAGEISAETEALLMQHSSHDEALVTLTKMCWTVLRVFGFLIQLMVSLLT